MSLEQINHQDGVMCTQKTLPGDAQIPHIVAGLLALLLEKDCRAGCLHNWGAFDEIMDTAR